MTEYHHWINVLAAHVYGENEYGESGHLSIFTLLKHLMMLLKYNFFWASFLLLTKDTDSIKDHAAQIHTFFKVIS